MKRWRFPILLLCIALLWWGSYDFVRRSFGTWPAIHDPAQLVSDCEQLLQGPMARYVDTSGQAGTVILPSECPSSVSALRPRLVLLFADAVRIEISAHRNELPYGYLVSPRAPEEAVLHRSFVTRRYKPGIYFWDSAYMTRH